MTLAFHPYANLFPLIEGQEFYDLAEDIRLNGLHDRIALIMVDGSEQILDGRNRYRALVWLVSTGEVLGSEWGRWSGEPLSIERLSDLCDYGLYCDAPVENDADALAFVLSKNLNRRHMSESQRAMVAADLATLGRGGDRSKAPIGALTDRQAADTLKVSERSVERAKGVKRTAVPGVVEAVRSGDMSVAAAAEIATQPVERQAEIAKALTRDPSGKLTDEAKKALAPLVREIRADKIAAKKERRAEREAETGRKIQALPGNFYGVAIEDFEWHHSAWSEETGSEKSPSMHYETAIDAQTPEAIVARCAERFACLADDCIIFKWVTTPHLAIGIKVLELQGFRYVTSLVWNKQRPGEARGPGYWFTGEHEIVLVGVRGKVVPPATAHFRSSFTTPVGAHSEKPDNLHEIIEFHWPSTPKVEFNARRRRDGWSAWGFDAPDAEASPDDLRQPFVASRAARDAERLWDHPAIAGLHTVSMTRDYPGGVSFNIATCLCGWSFRCETVPFALDQDDAVDAHWREAIALAVVPERAIETPHELSESASLVSVSQNIAERVPSSDAAPGEAEPHLAVVSLSGEVTAAAADATSGGASAAAAVAVGEARPVRTEVGFVHGGGRCTSRYYLTAEEVGDYSARYWRRDAVCPPGHTIGMSLEPFQVACSCGAVFLFPDGKPLAMDAAIELHFIQIEGAETSQPPPYDANDVIAIDQLAGSDWLKPAELDALELSECQQLKILSDFCHPQRDLQNVLGPLYVARGYAFERNGQWALRGQGWDRLRELEAADAKPAAPAPVLTEPYRAPQLGLFDAGRQLDGAPPAEIVDGCLQTRLPVDGDELAEQLALISIAAGESAEPEMLRHLVGKGLAHCGTTKVRITDDGRAFLAQLTSPANQQVEISAA